MPVSGWKAKIKMYLGTQRFQYFSEGGSSWSYYWGNNFPSPYNRDAGTYGVVQDIYLYDDPEKMDIFYFPQGGSFTGPNSYYPHVGKSYCADGMNPSTKTGFAYKATYGSYDSSGRYNSNDISLPILPVTVQHNGIQKYAPESFNVAIGDPNGPKGNYNFAAYTFSPSYTPQKMLSERLFHDFKTGTFDVVNSPQTLTGLTYTSSYGEVNCGLVIYDSTRQTLVKDWNELSSLVTEVGPNSTCYFCVVTRIDTNTLVVNDTTAPSVVISTVQRLNSSGATVPDETENDPANITVTAFDDISGVNKITIDGTDYTSSLTNIPATSTTLAGKSQQVSYSGVGTKVVKATATDVDGNISTEQSYTFSIVSPAAVTCNGWDETIGVTNWPAEANTDFSTATAVAGTGSNQGWEYVIITINNGLDFQDLTLVQLGQAVRNAFYEQPTMTGYKYYSLREHWPSILNPTANLNEILMTGSDSLNYARVNMKGVLPASKGGRWVSIGYCASTEILSLADFTSGPVIATPTPTPTPTPPPPTTGGGSSTSTPTSSNSAGAASNYHSRLLFINI